MRLEIFNYSPKRSTQTIRLSDESGDPLYEDTINLSKERERRQFAGKLRERFPSLKGKDIEAKLLDLLWEFKDDESTETPVRDSQADRLVRLIEGNGVVLFHDNTLTAFGQIPSERHYEVWKVRSKYFKQWMAKEFWQEEKKAPNSDAINSALNVIEGKACFEGPEFRLHNRVAWHEDDLWLDLTDHNWRAVRVSPEGWQVIEYPPVIFQRYSHQIAQVEPIAGGDAKQLLEFINLRDESQQILLLVYICTCFIPDFPHPTLHLHGEKGSAKTTLFRILRSLIDPSAVEVLSLPGDINQLVQKLSHHWVAYFDNVSHLSDWISDVLCRASTGEGFSKRELYTDDDDVIYSFRRCIGINGVNIVATRPDLLDRMILSELERISSNSRREERQLFAEFDEAKPAILGGILDVLARAMNIYPSVSVMNLPRMADFTRWGCAIAPALGYSDADFLQAYEANIRSQTDEVLSSNPVAEAVLVFMEDNDTWEGKPSELFDELTDIAENRLKLRNRAKSWPGAPNILMRKLNELRGNLREAQIVMESLSRTGQQGRRLRITKFVDKPSQKGSNNIDTSDTIDARDISEYVADTESHGESGGIGDDTPVLISTPILPRESVSDDSLGQIQGDSCVDSGGKIPKYLERDGIKDLLGMEISDALEIWRSVGAPEIPLGPGEKCVDLDTLLMGSPKKKHLQALRKWLIGVAERSART